MPFAPARGLQTVATNLPSAIFGFCRVQSPPISRATFGPWTVRAHSNWPRAHASGRRVRSRGRTVTAPHWLPPVCDAPDASSATAGWSVLLLHANPPSNRRLRRLPTNRLVRHTDRRASYPPGGASHARCAQARSNTLTQSCSPPHTHRRGGACEPRRKSGRTLRGGPEAQRGSSWALRLGGRRVAQAPLDVAACGISRLPGQGSVSLATAVAGKASKC
jgi:hypothetical protein